MNLTDTFYKIKLDISDYNLLALNDIARMFIIQFVVQILFFLRNDKVELFSIVFIENTLFILVGVFIYWIIFNNVILFPKISIIAAKPLSVKWQNTYEMLKSDRS